MEFVDELADIEFNFGEWRGSENEGSLFVRGNRIHIEIKKDTVSFVNN